MKRSGVPAAAGPALVLPVLLILAACGLSSCTRTDLLARGTLVIGIEGTPTDLDPRRAADAYSTRIDSLVFNGLIRPDERGDPAPDLAERWEMPDPRTYVFHLRAGVRFQDGRPFTGADVVSTLDALRDPSFGSPYLDTFEIIESMETPDPLTVRVRLREPHAPFLSRLSVGIVPADAGHAADPSRRPVGTGPFRVERVTPGDSVALAAFAGYFRGAPRIRRVIVRIVPNDLTRVLELRKGSIHLLVNGVPPDFVDEVRRDPALRVLTGPGSTYAYLGMNLDDPDLRKIAVRRAIAHAIDRDAVISHVLGGLARPAAGLLPPGHWAYEGRVPTYPYDPAEARRLLDGAGYPPGPDGVRLRLSYKTSVSPLARRVGEVLVRQLGDVGIACEMRSYEWGAFFSDIRSGNFQLYTLQWVGLEDPDIYYYLFHSSSLPPRGANRVRYTNPELDALLDRGRRTLDAAARRRIYGRVQEVLARDLPYVSLWHPEDVVAVRREVRGFVLYPGGALYSLESARVGPP